MFEIKAGDCFIGKDSSLLQIMKQFPEDNYFRVLGYKPDNYSLPCKVVVNEQMLISWSYKKITRSDFLKKILSGKYKT
jgi:hypothetical protein